MSEPIIQCIYGYINPNGDTLQLRLGRIPNARRNPDDKDTGYRWSFVGKKIPMPVWSGDWFKGHPEPVMTEWLMEHGSWAKATMVDLVYGKTEVYDLPSAPEDNTDYCLIEEAIRAYCDEDWKLCDGAELHRMLTGETCITASMNAVERILFAKYAKAKATATETNWVSVSTGRYPQDGENVRLLYQHYNSNKYFCDIMACKKNDIWYDPTDGIKFNVRVTAWKRCNETEATAPETKTETDWIPVSSGQYPADMQTVQVTYLSRPHNVPMCDNLAYRCNGRWLWDDGDCVAVEITAWKSQYHDQDWHFHQIDSYYSGMIMVSKTFEVKADYIECYIEALKSCNDFTVAWYEKKK